MGSTDTKTPEVASVPGPGSPDYGFGTLVVERATHVEEGASKAAAETAAANDGPRKPPVVTDLKQDEADED